MNTSDHTASGHRLTWELIPWIVNGRASDDERRMADEHLRGCTDCREEFEFQRQLHAAVAHENDLLDDPSPSLERLLARIDQPEEVRPAQQVHAPRSASRLLRGLAAAVVIEGIALSALSAAFWMQAPVYRTLTAAEPAAMRPSIRLVPSPAMTLEELQQLLAQSHMQIVSGPSEAGVYSLAPLSTGDSSANQLALQRLRAHPGVRFAEPVNSLADSP